MVVAISESLISAEVDKLGLAELSWDHLLHDP